MSLFTRRCFIFLRVVRRCHKFLYGVLGVVVVVAEVFGTFVRGDGAGAVAFCVVGVAHLDVRPDGKSCRVEIAAQGRLKIIDGEIVISLF